MSQQALRLVNFGKSRTGLVTVGYTIFNTDGSTQAARTTSGVYELTASSGIYGVNVMFPDSFKGSILWDTGESTGRILFAAEDFSYLRENPQTQLLVSGTIIASGEVISGSSVYNVLTNISASSGFYDGYTIRITDPVSGSASRPVDTYSSVSGTFVVDPALPFIPSSGSQVFILTIFNDQQYLGQVG